MENVSLGAVTSAVKGRLNDARFSGIEINRVSTDSRTIERGSIFFAIKGEKFDGHDFIDTVIKNGASCIVSDMTYDRAIPPEMPVIYVMDTTRALMNFAENYLMNFNIPVVAVTGSVGKTTTRELIYSVLSQKYKKVVRPIKNLNNHIGVPLTAFEVDRNTDAAVFELGMNHFGEIEALSKIVKPDIGVITNIGDSHIEFLGSRNGILMAKLEIVSHMRKGGKLILNSEDDLLRTVKSSDIEVIFPNFSSMDIEPPQPGRHMVINCGLAYAVGIELGLTEKEIKAGLEKFDSPSMRLEIKNLKNGVTIINDAYNASPQSMLAALDVLSAQKGRKIAILGDMRELGADAEKYHRETGRNINPENTDLLFTLGESAKFIFDEAGTTKMHFKSKDELLQKLLSTLRPGDVVLIKASRGMKFEEIAQRAESMSEVTYEL